MKNALGTLRHIIQQLESEGSHDRKIDVIVSAVCDAMQVEVCSLYVNQKKKLVLTATKGLDPSSVNKVKMRVNTGLVGFTAQSRHPVNIEDASAHPNFKYYPGINEEEFHAFLGVPIIFKGELFGVLVVQERQIRKFNDDEEAFLVTVSSQLATVLSHRETLVNRDAGLSIRLQGVKGSTGIGIGNLHFVKGPNLENVDVKIITDAEQEIEFFLHALERTRQELRENENALASSLPADVASLFGVYSMLLEDVEMIQKITDEINTGVSSAGALKRVINAYANQFENMEDEYLRSKSEDIRNLGNKLYGNMISIDATPDNLEQNIILAGDLISITEIARYAPEQLSGIICSAGSKLSHTVVLAHALGIPAVMGVGDLKHFSNGTMVVVDGHQGQVIINPTETVISEYQDIFDRERKLHSQLEYLRDQPAVTKDNIRIKLYTNTGLLADLSPGLLQGAEGIGLYRTEIPFMLHENFPTEDEQYHIYRNVLQAYDGKPVYIRTLDIGGDKQLPYFSIHENNPALGWRGIRFTLDNSSIFMSQIRALLRASEGLDNLHIILPMISRVDEVTRFRLLLNDAMEQLLSEKLLIKAPRVGIMLEVPGSISILPFLVEQLDFVSIGSNDLSQYLLAVDRDNPRVSQMYDHLHPSVIHEINRIVRICSGYEIDVSLCGEMATDPLAVVLLVGMGLRTLSVSAYNLTTIKYILSTIDTKIAATLLEQALVLHDELKIRAMIRDYLEEVGLSEILEAIL